MSRAKIISGATLLLLVSLGVLAALAQTAEKPPTELYVRTNPPGAEIIVDGEKQGTSPKLFEVEPGRHKLIVQLEGYGAEAKTVTIREGRIKRVILELRRWPEARNEEALRSPAVEGVNALANWGFEDAPSYQRWPSKTGVWSGNWSKVVAAERGITPRSGSKMLRFDCTSWGIPSRCPASQVSQIIDLSDRMDAVREGLVKVRASAYFNRVKGGENTDTRFRVVLFAYRGRISDNFQNYENSRYMLMETGPIDTDADPATWQRASTEMLVPRNADYLIVDLIADENVSNETSGKEFDGHYVDDVSVTFK